MEHFDVAVIGAGFGGISCALRLAEKGAKVALFERLSYPGGCASTFVRQGYRFESGATLFSGLGPGQVFGKWIEDYDLDVKVQLMDPVAELRTAEFELLISSDRRVFMDRFCALDGAPEKRLRSFFDWQHRCADALWQLFDDPSLLPPLSASSLFRHVKRSPRYLPLLGAMGKSLEDILRRRGLCEFEPLRTYLDAVCQITVQVSADQAEGPFALAAMDYFFRGTGHIHGGVGNLASALTDTISDLGGQVYLADAARSVRRTQNRWTVKTRRREVQADVVVANLLPQNLSGLLDKSTDECSELTSLSKKVETGWGAAMLYLGLDRQKLERPQAHHIEMVDSIDASFIEGNHLFCSVGGADEYGRAPEDQRVATISTHVDVEKAWHGSKKERIAYIDNVYDRMRSTLAKRAPEIDAARVFEMTGSPRTFQRFTNRHRGYVGGIPRVVGLHNYTQRGPLQIMDGLYMVGDTAFPGQSTLAVAIGGLRVADKIAGDILR